MAMLAALRALRARGAVGPLVVAHLNHRLRGAASDRDALFVAATARAVGVPCVLGEAERDRDAAGNEEEWARDVRYRFFATVRAAAGAGAACVAHTRDDQAETVLLRLARGAGPRALAGMEARRADGVVRPLLDRSRSECAAYLAEAGGIAVHDASNDDTTRTRSRIRHVVLPALEASLGVDVRARLARLAADLRVECDLADRHVATLLPPAGHRVGLAVAAIGAAGRAAPRLVHAWLAREGVRASERQVAAIVHIARAGGPSAVVDLGGCRVERCYELVEIVPAAGHRGRASGREPAWSPVDIAVPGATALPNGWRLTARWCRAGVAATEPGSGMEQLAVVLAGRRLGLPLRARALRPGDRIRLWRGRRKVSDLLIDARVPRRDRAGLFVVAAADDTLVWVPGVATSPEMRASGEGERSIALVAERIEPCPAPGMAEDRELELLVSPDRGRKKRTFLQGGACRDQV